MEVTDQNEVHYNSSAGIKDTDILHDLLLVIKSITKGEASVSLKTVENILECSIDASTNLPSVRIFYKISLKTISENNFYFLKDKRLEVNENNLNLKKVIERKNVELTKKIEDVLDDLLALAEFINSGGAFISRMMTENAFICRIEVSDCQPYLLLFYKNYVENFIQSESHSKYISILSKINKNPNILLTQISRTELDKNMKRLNKSELPREMDLKKSLFKGSSKNKNKEGPFIPTEKIEDIIISKKLESGTLFYLQDVLNSSNQGFISQSGNTEQTLSFFNCKKLNVSVEKDKKILERIKRGEKPYSCEVCERSFTFLSSLKMHEKMHEAHVCKSCKGSFPSLGIMQQHEKMPSEEQLTPCIYCGKKFLCAYCGKAFSTKLEKQIHERSHPREKSYSCTYCNKTFISNSTKQVHERTHTGERPYACTFCDKTFTSYKRKLAHKKTVHEKPYACDKTFISSSNKCSQERIHTRERVYACSYCDKTFSTNSKMQIHERFHTGEKPYSCSYCDKTFRICSSKQYHERSHTGEKPFVCIYCHKTFMSSIQKQLHQKTHTGERPYVCTFCDKTFITNSSKQIHERIHTGERPYACTYCDKTFSSSSGKHSHEKTHR